MIHPLADVFSKSEPTFLFKQMEYFDRSYRKLHGEESEAGPTVAL